ncbi:YraN family protein [Cellulophaga sp. Z1A5H]|uniref:YraN family protein n=1 Tax=Cellulophaga sp. Z1A5H TaxID=2687291 RepID=UPI0013FD9B7F|nr:YraN family protein [Cellulophaga sp. Z1A5H]
MNDYDHKKDWFYEGQISSKLVDYLRNKGFEILKDNSKNIHARGVDIIAVRDGIKELIEVKGYPTDFYTKGQNKGLLKKTKPKLQAKHWFSEVLLSSFCNYQKHRSNKYHLQIAVAFPLFDRYTELIKNTSDFFIDFGINIKVYLVDENGLILEYKLNQKINTN